MSSWISQLHIIFSFNLLDFDTQRRWLCEFQQMIEPRHLLSIELLYNYYSFYEISMSSFIPILEMVCINGYN
jgi:hypothetical protein